MPVGEEPEDGDTMQVICMDGTVLQCQRFEAIDSGVLLFGESRQSATGETDEEEAEDEETEAREEATAFVPIHQLRFVLPEGVQPGGAGTQSLSSQVPQQGPETQPPIPGTPRGGQAPPPQSTGTRPSPPRQGRGQPFSQPETGRRQ